METTKPSTDSSNVTLLRGSIELLASCLGQSGWSNKRKDINAGGLLAEALECLVQDRPTYTGDLLANGAPADQQAFSKFRAIVRDWERAPIDVAITNSGFQSAITCLKHFSDERRLPGNIFTSVLLDAFKLTE